MRFGTEEIDGVHFGIGFSTVFDSLDGCKVAMLAEQFHGGKVVSLVKDD